MNSFYVTTPIYYANSLPHLGHLYTMIVADAVHRYKEQRGIETYFLTGTDEHGINIERAAERAGRTPQEQADYVVDYYKRMTAQFALDTEHGGYDIFMRPRPIRFTRRASISFGAQSRAPKPPKGREAIYKGHYEGWFCAPCAAYKTEDEYSKHSRASARSARSSAPPRWSNTATAATRASAKSPGRSKYEAVTLERGVTHDPEFERWANKVWQFGAGLGAEVSLQDFRKDIILELYNEAGQLVARLQGVRGWVRSTRRCPSSTPTPTPWPSRRLKLENEGWERDPEVRSRRALVRPSGLNEVCAPEE